MALSLSYRPTYTSPAIVKYLKHIRLPALYRNTIPIDPAGPESAGWIVAPSSMPRMREWGASSAGFTFLQGLQKYHLCKMPFANLYLHYSTHKKGTLDAGLQYEYLINSSGLASEFSFLPTFPLVDPYSPSSILTNPPLDLPSRNEREVKWVARKASGGRGGSCTMNNGFFGTVMRSLGMRVKTTGARVAMSFGAPGGRRGGFGGWNHQVNLVEFLGKTWLVDVGFGAQGKLSFLKLIISSLLI
jgi:hypothetical protein